VIRCRGPALAATTDGPAGAFALVATAFVATAFVVAMLVAAWATLVVTRPPTPLSIAGTSKTRANRRKLTGLIVGVRHLGLG